MQFYCRARVANPKKIISAFLLFFLLVPVLVAFTASLPDGPELAQSPASAQADTGDEKVYYFLNDHLGSVDVVLDDQGNVVERRDYMPYGSQRAEETFNGVPITELGFTGKHLDDETGLNYYGARYYDPVAGRFIQGDPFPMSINKMSQAERNAFLSNPQNLNMYAYVQNNPVRYTDPTGMYGEDVHYTMTFYLAEKASFTQDQSKEIATYDQYADVNPDTKPEAYGNLNSGITVEYHYQAFEDSLINLKDAIENGDLANVGTALHTFQDSYSHYKVIPAEHVLLNLLNQSPDTTKNDPKKALRMAQATFSMLRILNASINGRGKLSEGEYNEQTINIWNSMKTDMNDFFNADDKSDTVIGKATIEIDSVDSTEEK